MKHRPAPRRSFALVAFLAAACLGLAWTAHADPPAGGTGTPPAAVAPAPNTPPATPPAPAVVPAPAAVRRPEDETPPLAPGATAPGAAQPETPSIFARAAAFVQTREGFAAQLSERDGRIADLTAQLGVANGTIATLNAELAELRAGKASLEAAFGKLEGEQKSVADTVASLGFPPAALPGAAPFSAATESGEGLVAQFAAETDPVKRADLAAKITKLRGN